MVVRRAAGPDRGRRCSRGRLAQTPGHVRRGDHRPCRDNKPPDRRVHGCARRMDARGNRPGLRKARGQAPPRSPRSRGELCPEAGATLHPAPCTLHPAPCTLHPNPNPNPKAKHLLALLEVAVNPKP
ncbi:hypothetical protein T484DRAFT_2986372 [Baffinella frigidus]|nr:hypothetical protein T484DRAFT_2986372 [Cryptophyta sp. CCMP2293]